MADYIKREDALESIMNGMAGTGFQARAMDCLDSIFVPTADVVDVVRRKDCRHWRQSSIDRSFGLCVCGRLNVCANAYDTFFCADGERKERKNATD